jgi:hypothetical protein
VGTLVALVAACAATSRSRCHIATSRAPLHDEELVFGLALCRTLGDRLVLRRQRFILRRDLALVHRA